MPFITKLGSVAARAYGWLASVAQEVVSDAYFYLVSMLLPGNGTNGAQNNTFLDASTNNATLTRNGNPTQGSFSPRSQTGWGITFNRSYLSATLTGKAPGTGPFTYELFFFIDVQDAAVNNVAALFNTRGSGTGADGIDCQITSTGAVQIGTSGATLFTSATGVVSRGVWYHLAIVRFGSTCSVFLDGFLLGTFTSSTNYSSTNIYLAIFGGLNDWFKGTISNFRYTRAVVYLSGFAPPVSPLTTISNTEFLTAQSNRYIDSSPNNFAITLVAANGSSSIQPFSPFAPSNFTPTSYSARIGGASDYLSVPANTAFAFGTGNFTVEAWIYDSGTTANFAQICGASTFGLANEYLVAVDGATKKVFVQLGASGGYTSTGTYLANTWVHLAVVRSGTTVTIYAGGVSIGSFTSSTSVASTIVTTIGAASNASAGSRFAGLISNVRVVKGTAVYTSAFTPPTSPLTAIANTSLLTCQNATFIDNSTNAFAITVSGTTQPTTTNPFQAPSPAPVSYSGYFDGTGDSLSLAGNAAFAFGTGDFTIEGWIYSTSTTSALFDTRAAVSSLTPYIFSDAGGVKYYVNGSAVITGSVLATNIWVHIAVVRASGVSKLYINGIQSGSNYTDSNNFTLSNTVYVGNTYNSAVQTSGYISNFRVVKGTAVYTANFLPSNVPLTAISGTSLLTCQSPTFIDNSSNAFAITVNGNTIPAPVNPYSYQTPISNTAYSARFPTIADYLGVALGAGQAFGTGDFTVECWIYTSATSINILMPSTGTSSWGFLTFSNALYWQWNAANLFSGGSVPLNTWVHLAVCRVSSSTSGYINGVRVFGGTANNDTNNYSATPTTRFIGPATGGSAPCSISNVRIVKGTAVYTANFTPPTSPLTSIANTVLLTCQNIVFVDNGPSALAITRNGAAITTPTNPFGYSFPTEPTPVSYSALTNGGSGYFDGTGDYLTTGSVSNLAFGTGDFTVEGWAYPVAGVNNGVFQISATVGGLQAGNTTSVALSVFTTNSVAFYVSNTNFTSANNRMPFNAWTHFAIVRSSGVSRLYLNGVLDTTNGSTGAITDTTNYTGTYAAVGGYYSTLYLWNGYISNLRVVRGTAVYLSNFAPPVAPVTAVTNTQLLLNYTNAGIYDAASKNVAETVGDAQISTAQSKWGGGSMAFDGTGDWLLIPHQPTQLFGVSPFTIELWVYRNASGTYGLVGKGTGTTGWLVSLNSSNQVVFTHGSTTLTSSSTVAATTWTFITIVREGTGTNQTKIYIDGTSAATGTVTTDFVQTNSVYVGADRTGGSAFNGYIDDLRITKFARYTANFTPPTAAFPTQ